jgi:hypothetical protein
MSAVTSGLRILRAGGDYSGGALVIRPAPDSTLCQF